MGLLITHIESQFQPLTYFEEVLVFIISSPQIYTFLWRFILHVYACMCNVYEGFRKQGEYFYSFYRFLKENFCLIISFCTSFK